MLSISAGSFKTVGKPPPEDEGIRAKGGFFKGSIKCFDISHFVLFYLNPFVVFMASVRIYTVNSYENEETPLNEEVCLVSTVYCK